MTQTIIKEIDLITRKNSVDSIVDLAKVFLKYIQVKNDEKLLEGADEEDIDKVTHLKIQKLMYYVEGVFMAYENEELVSENVCAWQHGPVYRTLYDELKHHGNNIINLSEIEVSEDVFDKVTNNEKLWSCFAFVYREYGQFTAWGLREKTHEENSPWDITYNNPQKSNNIIDKHLIKQFFIDNEVLV